MNRRPWHGIIAARVLLVAVLSLLAALPAGAVTYTNAATTFSWIDASTHTKVGYNTAPYKFTNPGSCGSTPPTLDDSLSDNIPMGFTFNYGGVDFTSVRIMSNGRLQFNNNTTCGFGSPVTQLPYPNAGLNYSIRIYGNDLDPTLKSEVAGYNTVCTSRATCYVSYATLGTSPNRQFVVTWNHVPEWTATTTASGSYDLQVILQENGEFIYQFGADTPGPGNTNAQVGWQVSTTDYDVPNVGFPANNSAIRFYIPSPVSELRMEESSWGGAGSVVNTSGGTNGSPVGSAQTVAGGKICRGASIPSNTTTSTISAIDSGYDVDSQIGSSGTITFWYNSNVAWNAGGSDSQLLDASVANNRWFYLVKQSNGRLSFNLTDNANSNFQVNTGNNSFAANTWQHVAVTWNLTPVAANNRLRIYINGALAQSSAIGTAQPLSSSIGTLYIGDNRSSFTTNPGTGNSANGTIDEVRIYNYEATDAIIKRDYNATRSCPVVDHIRVEHDGSGLTCAAETLTVKACADSTCSTLYTAGEVTGNVTWTGAPGGTLPFSMAAGGSGQTTVTLPVASAQTVTLGTSAVSPAPGSGSDCKNTSSGALSCSLPFVASSNCFDAVEVGNAAGTPIYTKLSGTAFSLDVRALPSGSVPAAYTGTVQVTLVDPTAASGNCADNNAGLNAAASYTFTAADGNRKTFAFNYPNAARNVKVRIRDSAVTTPSCSSDNFAIRPTGITVATSNAGADATGTSTTATPAVKAGAAFALTATASATGYDGTPSINAAMLSPHSGALATGALSGIFPAATAATGVSTGSSFAYTEAGYFRLAANGVFDSTFTAVDQPNDCTNDFSNSLVGGKYGCKFGNTAATPYFGRFTPDHFTTTVTPGCVAGAFTYAGQPLTVRVNALNTAGSATLNYDGAGSSVFAKAVTLTDGNGSTVGGFGGTGSIAASAFASGVATVSTPAYTFNTAKTVPTTILVRATESAGGDGVTSAGSTEGATVIRAGRLLLRSGYGSELVRLSMPLEAQFWQEGGNAAIPTDDYWTTNIADSCTSIPAAAVSLGNYKGNLSAGETVMTLGGAFTAGLGSLYLSAPGAGNNGSVDVTINNATAGLPWFGANEVARGTFGLRKTPVIYLRENF